MTEGIKRLTLGHSIDTYNASVTTTNKNTPKAGVLMVSRLSTSTIHGLLSFPLLAFVCLNTGASCFRNAFNAVVSLS